MRAQALRLSESESRLYAVLAEVDTSGTPGDEPREQMGWGMEIATCV